MHKPAAETTAELPSYYPRSDDILVVARRQAFRSLTF